MQLCLTLDDVEIINPCYVVISFDGMIIDFGSFFRKYYGDRKGGPVGDMILFDKGVRLDSILSARENAPNVSGVIPQSGLRISGSLIALEHGFVYTARPSVSSLEEAIAAGLDMSGFGAGDPTYKMLLSGHMQQNLLEQYRDLAVQLTEARRALIEPIANMWEMSAYIAHDFKNYLNAIGMSADRLEMLNSPAARQSIDLVRSAVAQASSLADAISDIARNQKYERTAFEFHRILLANARIFEALLTRSIRLEFRLAEGPVYLQGNIPVFIGCLMTIISNAKQALGDEGSVTISTERREFPQGDPQLGLQPGSYAVIAIADDGPGIPPHLLSQVTKPFISSKGDGRGLGLASVAEYCRRQDGAVNIVSQSGVGTTVELLLPTGAFA